MKCLPRDFRDFGMNVEHLTSEIHFEQLKCTKTALPKMKDKSNFSFYSSLYYLIVLLNMMRNQSKHIKHLQKKFQC